MSTLHTTLTANDITLIESVMGFEATHDGMFLCSDYARPFYPAVYRFSYVGVSSFSCLQDIINLGAEVRQIRIRGDHDEFSDIYRFECAIDRAEVAILRKYMS